MPIDKTNDPILKHGEQYEYYYSDLQTAEKNYSVAQEYYVRLRTSFLQDVTQGIYDTYSAQGLQSLLEDFTKIISTEIDSKSKQEMHKQIDDIQTYLTNNLNKNSNLAQALKNALNEAVKERDSNKDVSTRVHNFQDRLNTQFQNTLSHKVAYDAYNEIIRQLQQQSLLSSQMSSAEYGFLKRNLLLYFSSSKGIAGFYKDVKDRIFSDHALIGYAKNLGGAYVEKLKTDAVNSAIQHLNGKLGFKMTANEGDSTNIHYDILSEKVQIKNSSYLKNVQSFLEDAGELNVAGAGIVFPDEFAYGMQSKQGWSINLLKTINDNVKIADSFFSIGDRKQIANSLGFLSKEPSYWRGWHNSILQLSKLSNFFSVIGQFQLGFFVHGQFIWMSDLITAMRKNGLYLAFYYPRRRSANEIYKTYTYPTSGEVAWQSPSYNYREISRLKIKQQSQK